MNPSPLRINVLLGLRDILWRLTGKRPSFDDAFLENPVLRLRVKPENPECKEIQLFFTEEEIIISAEGDLETKFAEHLQNIVLSVAPMVHCSARTPSSLH